MSTITPKSKAIILELDGVLCNNTHRVHFIDPCLDRNGKCRFAVKQSYFSDECKLEDGTIWKPDWESYYSAIHQDKVNQWCLDLLIQMEYSDAGISIIFITSRPEKYRKQTVSWLKEKTTNWDDCSQWLEECLFMRPELERWTNPADPYKTKIGTITDRRPSHIFKREIYETHIKDKYDVLFALEKDQECCDMYTEMGVQVLRVM